MTRWSSRCLARSPYLDQTATYATAGFDATRRCSRPPREWHCGGQWPKRPGDARGEWKAPASGHIEGYNPTKGGWQGVPPSPPACGACSRALRPASSKRRAPAPSRRRLPAGGADLPRGCGGVRPRRVLLLSALTPARTRCLGTFPFSTSGAHSGPLFAQRHLSCPFGRLWAWAGPGSHRPLQRFFHKNPARLVCRQPRTHAGMTS